MVPGTYSITSADLGICSPGVGHTGTAPRMSATQVSMSSAAESPHPRSRRWRTRQARTPARTPAPAPSTAAAATAAMTAIIDAVSGVPGAISVADRGRALFADQIVLREPGQPERLDQRMRPAVRDRPGHGAAAGRRSPVTPAALASLRNSRAAAPPPRRRCSPADGRRPVWSPTTRQAPPPNGAPSPSTCER